MSNGNLDEEGYTRHKVKYSEHFVDPLPNKVVEINEYKVDKQTEGVCWNNVTYSFTDRRSWW